MSPALDHIAFLVAGALLGALIPHLWRAAGSPRVNLGRFARRGR